MDSSFISVIIPVYNCCKYLKSCVESILSCGIDDLQLVLIDDGSSDGSELLCDELIRRDGRVKVKHTANHGPSHARNAGIELAAGEYITFADSDDLIDAAAFRKTVEKLRHITTDVLAADFYRVADNGTVLDRVFQIEDTAEPICDDGYKLTFLSAPDCFWNIWRYIYRREYIMCSGLRFAEGIMCGEDLQFSMKALMGTDNTAYYHNPYYYYRVNYGVTLTRRFSAQRAAQLMEMIASVYEPNASPEMKKLAEKLSREYILNLSMYREAPRAERAEIYGVLRNNIRLSESAVGVYSLFAKCVNELGIPFSAGILLGMKRIKRFSRYLKQRRHSDGS